MRQLYLERKRECVLSDISESTNQFRKKVRGELHLLVSLQPPEKNLVAVIEDAFKIIATYADLWMVKLKKPQSTKSLSEEKLMDIFNKMRRFTKEMLRFEKRMMSIESMAIDFAAIDPVTSDALTTHQKVITATVFCARAINGSATRWGIRTWNDALMVAYEVVVGKEIFREIFDFVQKFAIDFLKFSLEGEEIIGSGSQSPSAPPDHSKSYLT